MDVVEINFYAAHWWREFNTQRQLAGMCMMTDKPPFPELTVTSAIGTQDEGLV
jgi:hypothetical protein